MASRKQQQQQIDPNGSVTATVELPGSDGFKLKFHAHPKQFKSGNSGWWGQLQKQQAPDGSTVSVQVTVIRKV